ncbi:cytochrome oxidase putative small subunit CydP [Dyella sp. EPa41]|uniref:cytochrome oxidase putative small subunit CydP n=1 Tax=Dyella sp. EPa41 TaxID=1561194 RepID=UPI00191646B5|nr:cytochrome oxidase putative small subunit CydP [Dyella sp. EPa41]
MSMWHINPNRVELPRRPLRRLGRELVLLVLAKIALLTLIWWVAMASYERPDTRPAAIEHLLAPASASSTSPTDNP